MKRRSYVSKSVIIPQMLKSPHGIFQLDSGFTNPVPDGVSMRKNGPTRITWASTEPTEGQYDWSAIDLWISTATANNKQLAYSMGILAAPPAWIFDRGVTKYLWTDEGSEEEITYDVFKPWDSVAIPLMLRYMRDLCEHIDGKLSYIVIGGVGMFNESFMADPATLGETDGATMLPKWITSSNAIIDACGQTLHQTPFILAAGTPSIRGYSPSATAVDTLCRNAAIKYPRFGVMCDSLKATSNINYIPNRLVNDLSDTNRTGFQFLTSSTGFGGHTLEGTVQETLEVAINFQAHFVEAYTVDVEDPQYTAAFEDASERLVP